MSTMVCSHEPLHFSFLGPVSLVQLSVNTCSASFLLKLCSMFKKVLVLPSSFFLFYTILHRVPVITNPNVTRLRQHLWFDSRDQMSGPEPAVWLLGMVDCWSDIPALC